MSNRIRYFSIIVFVNLIFLSPAAAQQRVDLFIPLPFGDSLDATYYVPSMAPPAEGYPAMIFVHGFGLSKDWDTLNCWVYAQKGYVTLCYSGES